MVSQFSPADWTTFKWEGTANFAHYVTVVLLLTVFLAAELNPFYLKVCLARRHHSRGRIRADGVIVASQALLWMEPEHPFVIARLAGVFLCALPAVRELYQYVGDPR